MQSMFHTLFCNVALCIADCVPRRMFLLHIHAMLGSLDLVATP
jgi:hypothetical protein